MPTDTHLFRQEHGWISLEASQHFSRDVSLETLVIIIIHLCYIALRASCWDPRTTAIRLSVQESAAGLKMFPNSVDRGKEVDVVLLVSAGSRGTWRWKNSPCNSARMSMVEPMLEPLLRRCTSANRTVLLSNCIVSPKYCIFFPFLWVIQSCPGR